MRRRGILGAVIGLVAAPAIVRVTSIMPVSSRLQNAGRVFITVKPNFGVRLIDVNTSGIFPHFMYITKLATRDVQCGGGYYKGYYQNPVSRLEMLPDTFPNDAKFREAFAQLIGLKAVG